MAVRRVTVGVVPPVRSLPLCGTRPYNWLATYYREQRSRYLYPVYKTKLTTVVADVRPKPQIKKYVVIVCGRYIIYYPDE